MDLHTVLTDDGAVSPVIGVILMLGLTVILAAVVAGFLFSNVGTSEVPPQVTFDYDYEVESASGAGDGSLAITVIGGDTFTAGQVTFRGENLGSTGGTANAGSEWHERAVNASVGPEATVSGGQRAELAGLSDTFELELVWTASGGDTSAVLSTHAGPAA